jgi:hypothetical protein
MRLFCTFDLCIGIAAKSSHVYGTLVPSCLIERPWRTGGRGPFLVGQFGWPWCGEGPTMTGWRARVEPRAHQIADDSKMNPVLVHDRNLPHNQHATPQIAALSSCDLWSAFKNTE